VTLDSASNILNEQVNGASEGSTASNHCRSPGTGAALWHSVKWAGYKTMNFFNLFIPGHGANEASILLLETKYGLRIDIINGTSFKISASPPHQELNQRSTKIFHDDANGRNSKLSTSNAVITPPQDPIPSASILYRLFPDLQTSYLWYNKSSSPEASLDSPHVNIDDIENRYPLLVPFYNEWHDCYEAAFEHQGCHLGSGVEAFQRVDDQVAWETEGFLIACWLALQDDVLEVEYQPAKIYYLKKGRLEDELMRFFNDMEVLLSK
jgi:hypothetical protein